MTRMWYVLAALLLPALALAPKPVGAPLDALVSVLATTGDVATQRDILHGMSAALAGRRKVAAPAGWSAVHRKLADSPDAEVRERVLALSVLFGDSQAMAALRRTVDDPKAERGMRERALTALLERGEGDLTALLQTLLDDAALRAAAIRGLARFGAASTPALLLRRYPTLSDAEKADAVATLASRPAYALALLDAIAKKELPHDAVTPFQARQLLALNDAKVSARLNAVWGSIRATAKDREGLLVRYRALAKPDDLKRANRGHGRAVWVKTCGNCHTLFGEGAKIGPDLTGSQRTNPEYILLKVLDPNAVVPRDFQVTRVVTETGRVLTGLIKSENDRVLVLQTPTEEVRVLKSDIETRDRLTQSLMPEGQLQTLTDAEIRDLLAYLAGGGQAPLPKK